MTVAPSLINKNLDAELIESEGPGILLWLIEGCIAWQREGLEPPKAVTEATDSYFTAQDTIGRWKEDCCVADAQGWEGTTPLFQSWKVWTEANSGSRKST